MGIFRSLAIALAVPICLLFCGSTVHAQTFQRLYGTTALRNVFTKVIPDPPYYYVLGYEEPAVGALPRATVTRLDAQGNHLWTVRLDVASQWNDAILGPEPAPSPRSLIVVGHTLPFNGTTRSLAGVVTPAGLFTGRFYDMSDGRETLHRIVRNPVPDNPSFPYYIAGSEWEPGSGTTWDDVVLLTMDASLSVGWKKKYQISTDDEFFRDLEVLANGDLILAGPRNDGGFVLRLNNTGTVIGGVSSAAQLSFVDVAFMGNNIIAAGHEFPTFAARLMMFNPNLSPPQPVWQIALPVLTAIRNVWTSGNDIYVTGSANVGGRVRGVVLKLNGGAPSPTLMWMKHLDDGEVSYLEGTSWSLSSGRFAFTDGRAKPGQRERAFISVHDLDMNTCMTKTAPTTISATNYSFNSPAGLTIILDPTPPSASVGYDILNWPVEVLCCKCPPDAFKNMTYRPTSGPNLPIACGDTADWFCILPTFTVGGEFMCEGDSCPPMPPISWTLTHPTLGHVASGADNGPNFQVAIPGTLFTAPGVYTLLLSGICDMDTCYCEIFIETLGCCCRDYQAFIHRINSAVSITSIPGGYQFSISNTLLSCNFIEWVDWGDGQVDYGPFYGGSVVSHTYNSSGTYTIKYLAIEKDPTTGLYCWEKVDSIFIVGTKDTWEDNQLRLYPNPTTNSFTLELPAPASAGTRIRITDPTGRLALEATVEVGSERQLVKADTLPAGLYFVQVMEAGRPLGVIRFVKQ